MPTRETRIARKKRTKSRTKRAQNEEVFISDESATKECTAWEAIDPLDDCFVCGSNCTIPSETIAKARITAELQSECVICTAYKALPDISNEPTLAPRTARPSFSASSLYTESAAGAGAAPVPASAPPNRFQCTICKQWFPKTHKLQDHLLMHQARYDAGARDALCKLKHRIDMHHRHLLNTSVRDQDSPGGNACYFRAPSGDYAPLGLRR
jgi:hypothetical protein